MNEAAFIEALRTYWMTSGAALTTLGASPVVALQLWEDDEAEPDPPVPYHRTTIRSAGAAAITVGRTREEVRGTILVQVFVPHDMGLGPGERLASAVSKKWRAFRHSRVRCGPPSIAGLSRQGAFNRQLVTIGWRADLRPATA